MQQTGKPQTLVQAEMAFDRHAWTALDEQHPPAAALIAVGPWAGILLARSMVVEQHGTLLQGVRWVRMPCGWRLRVFDLLSMIMEVRWPEEWLFNQIWLTLASNGMFIARLNDDPRRPLVLPSPSPEPYHIVKLSGAAYRLMVSCPGRQLCPRLAALFPELDAASKRAQVASAWPVGPLPWRLFAG
jgi:hypothetical protein